MPGLSNAVWVMHSAACTDLNMVNFTNTSTLSDVLNCDATKIGPAELDSLKKTVLIQYISHLQGIVKAKDEAMDKLSNTFQGTIAKLTTESINSAVSRATEISTHPPPVSNVKEHQKPPPPPTNIKPYDSDPIEEFIDTELKEELDDLNKSLKFTKIDQREVCYYGKYKYKYTGGDHEPKEYPEPMKKVVAQVEQAFNTKVTSCLVTKYSNGQSFCPPHSDDERSIHPNSKIHTLSFGATRVIRFTDIFNSNRTVSISLKDNTILSFSRKSQAYWRHEILTDEDIDEPRYSYTFRFNEPYNLQSTVIFGDSNTKYLNFGEEDGTFGKWIVGERIQAQRIQDIPSVENINPYSNIVLHTGINDVLRRDRLPASQLVSELESKCKSIHSIYPKTKIFLSPLLPTKLPQLNSKVCQVNEGIVALSKKHHNLVLIDNSIFAREDACLKLEYGRYMDRDDNIHLGKLGIRVFASSIKSYIFGRNINITRSLSFQSAFNNDNRYN